MHNQLRLHITSEHKLYKFTLRRTHWNSSDTYTILITTHREIFASIRKIRPTKFLSQITHIRNKINNPEKTTNISRYIYWNKNVCIGNRHNTKIGKTNQNYNRGHGTRARDVRNPDTISNKVWKTDLIE